MSIVPGNWDSMTKDEAVKGHYLYGALHGVFGVANKASGNPDILKVCAETVENIEYKLQEFWGFERDKNKHRYWYRLPGCTCPKLDNEDVWGSGLFYYSESCPAHGSGA